MGVIIGMDPHKRSATVEVIDERGRVLDAGRFGTDRDGYAALLASGRNHADRVWAIEGCNGIGGTWRTGWCTMETPWWTCRRSCPRRCGCSPPATAARPTRWNAHSVAIAALRAPNLVQVQPDPQLVVLGMLADRRDELGRARTQVVNRLLLELDAALEGSMSSPIMIDWLGLPCQDSMAQAPWCSLAAEFTMSAG